MFIFFLFSSRVELPLAKASLLILFFLCLCSFNGYESMFFLNLFTHKMDPPTPTFTHAYMDTHPHTAKNPHACTTLPQQG